MEVKRFLEKLSSDTPTPGGGSASALAGTLSASLILMAAGLSLRKGKLRKGEIKEIQKDVLAIQRRLFRAIEEDAKSYEAVLKAFRLPKRTEKECLVRAEAIQKAYQEATVTPQLVCQRSIRLLEYSYLFILKGNPNAVSDAGVAAFLADTALRGGLANIGINAGPVRDKTFKKKMRLLAGKWERKRNQLMSEVEKALSGALTI